MNLLGINYHAILGAFNLSAANEEGRTHVDTVHTWYEGGDSKLLAIFYVILKIESTNSVIPACHSNYADFTSDFEGFMIGFK